MDKISRLKESLNDLLKEKSNATKEEIIRLSRELDEHIVEEQKNRLRLLISDGSDLDKRAR
ncbi:Spo0E like sporulation regulatory protein [Clostridium aceticum]|uniref:Spo0E like sporulation regulatory protein n=1 Tax=Clostridium aceticum TaxID=84022 RepID=A0A0D8IA39_9CLOT|nr:Spo0E family sporulation regulatory protein-aspartic acid phosphatase [Clostridium aceticum]AKL96306.1 Spo0E like sporulation regulatory protein [Clostridium aceticum]KJF26904.1 hypothetical protein TZ02_10205 [Clostridium aceticum]